MQRQSSQLSTTQRTRNALMVARSGGLALGGEASRASDMGVGGMFNCGCYWADLGRMAARCCDNKRAWPRRARPGTRRGSGPRASWRAGNLVNVYVSCAWRGGRGEGETKGAGLVGVTGDHHRAMASEATGQSRRPRPLRALCSVDASRHPRHGRAGGQLFTMVQAPLYKRVPGQLTSVTASPPILSDSLSIFPFTITGHKPTRRRDQVGHSRSSPKIRQHNGIHVVVPVKSAVITNQTPLLDIYKASMPAPATRATAI